MLILKSGVAQAYRMATFAPSPFHLTAKKLRFNQQSLHNVTLIIIIIIIIIIINEMVNVITLNPYPQKRGIKRKILT